MRLNHKQSELIEQLAHDIQQRFPEIKFVDAAPSPEGENTMWLHFTKPDNDDRFIALSEYAGQRESDILLDYGYHFVVLPTVENGKHTAALQN